MTTGGKPEPFAATLRRLLDEQGVSVRELARRIAGSEMDAAKVEQERRRLSRYLAGENVPQRPAVSRIEAALGLAEGSLPSKEDAPRPQRSADILAGLDNAVRSLTELLGQGAEVDADRQPVLDRLEELRAAVEAQSAATESGMKALAAGIRRVERRLDALAPPAPEKRAAR